jgi:hypothetical protein
MNVERKTLLIYMLGFIQGKLNCSGTDARVILDQKLTHMNQPIATKEELSYLIDLRDEIDFAMMQMGINRRQARKLGINKKRI